MPLENRACLECPAGLANHVLELCGGAQHPGMFMELEELCRLLAWRDLRALTHRLVIPQDRGERLAHPIR